MAAKLMAGFAVAGVLALSACGGGTATTSGSSAGSDPTQSPTQTQADENKRTPSSEELLTKVQENLRTATSLKLHVSGTSGGTQAEIEIAGNREGTNQKMQMKIAGGLGEAEIITVAGADYVKGDEAFWTANGVPAAQVGQLEGKYVTRGTTEFSSQYNLGLLLKQAETGGLSLQDKLNTKVEEDTVDGRKAYKLSSRVGNDDTIVWVAADGDNQLIKVTGSSDGNPMSMTFEDWNDVQPFAAPPESDVIRR